MPKALQARPPCLPRAAGRLSTRRSRTVEMSARSSGSEDADADHRGRRGRGTKREREEEEEDEDEDEDEDEEAPDVGCSGDAGDAPGGTDASHGHRLTRTVEVFDPYLGRWTKLTSSVGVGSDASSAAAGRLERALAMAERVGDDAERLHEAVGMLKQLCVAVASHLDGIGGDGRRHARSAVGSDVDAPGAGTEPYRHRAHAADDGLTEEEEGRQSEASNLALLMSRVHSAAGWVRERLGSVDAAEACYRSAIAWAPDLPDAHYSLAMRLIRRRGYLDPEAVLHLEAAVAGLPRMHHARGEGDHAGVTDVPGDWRQCWLCVQSYGSGSLARWHLALSNALAGKDDAAASHLASLGYTLRLSRHLLTATPARRLLLEVNRDLQDERLDADGGRNGGKMKDDPAEAPPVRLPAGVWAVDGAIPVKLLAHLRDVLFGPESAFWSDHRYHDPMTGYFSYHCPIDASASGGRRSSPVEVAIDEMRAVLLEADPRLAAVLRRAVAAEWWVHSRTPHEGHQMHFDTDERSLRAEAEPKVAHPLVSTVLFLEVPEDEGNGKEMDTSSRGGGEGGAPAGGRSTGGTIVVDQRLGEGAEYAAGGRAWVAHPVANRIIAFDGALLHGVLPVVAGSGDGGSGGGRRLTLMVGWWGKELRPGVASTKEAFGPCMSPPWCEGNHPAEWSWPGLFCDSGEENIIAGESRWGPPPSRSRGCLHSVSPAWERVNVQAEGGDEGWGRDGFRMPPVHPGLRFFLRTPEDFEDAYTLHNDAGDEDG